MDPSPFDALLLDSVCPIDAADLGRGARLLVPNGLAFGALQWRRGGKFQDWFRDGPDRHSLPGSRHSLHLGVDLAFHVRRGEVHSLPGDLPLRAPADGVVAASHAAGAAELAPGGLIILHEGHDAPSEFRGQKKRSVRPFTYLGDVRETKRPGDRVRRGEVIASTLIQRPHGGRERVVVHFGIGLSIPGHGLEFLDPSVLLRVWKVLHPVFPGSTCTPDRLRGARPGRWRAPGSIEGGWPGAEWDRRWRTRY